MSTVTALLLCLWGHSDADSDRWKQTDHQKQGKMLLLERLFAAAKYKTFSYREIKPRKSSFLFCAAWKFLQAKCLIWSLIYQNMTVQATQGNLGKAPKKAPLTTFSWIWQLDTDMLMDSSSGEEGMNNPR